MPDAARADEAGALDWVIRLRDPSFKDWDGLSAWLEAEPAHAQIFDRLSLADDAVEAELNPPVRGSRTEASSSGSSRQTASRSGAGPRRRRRRVGLAAIWTTAAALAACLVASFGLWRPGGLLRDPTQLYVAGKQARAISWGDRGEVDLAPGSRLAIDRRAAGVARLEEGQATFRIRHDPRRPVVIEVGQARVVDIGTVFALRRRSDGLDLTVSEGQVRYEGGGRQLVVRAGQSLRASGDVIALAAAHQPVRQAPRPSRLAYDCAPLARVANDLSRNGVLSVRADRSVAGRTFTGTLALDGESAAVRRRIELLLGVVLKQEGQGWVMTAARDRAAAD